MTTKNNMDARILSLYKHHYMDQYEEVDCEYSCLGYYDGISFHEIDVSNESSLYQRKSNICISPLWFAAADVSSKQDGTYSIQNIGIFRFNENETEDFWKQNLPYLTVSFVQLKDRQKYVQIGKILETRFTDSDHEPTVKTLVYETYDNADLVVLVKSNSLRKLNDTIVAIQQDEDLLYIHSILCISEDLLKSLGKYHGIEKDYRWGEINCFVEETVKNTSVELIYNGGYNLVKRYKEDLEKLCKEYNFSESNIRYSNSVGHSNFRVSIDDADVFFILKMLCSGGPGTRNKELYQIGLYNAETYLLFEEKKHDGVYHSGLKKNKDNKKWCSSQIKKYQKKAKHYLDIGNEDMYSYLVSLIQTLNILSQFEKFSISNDIFLSVYPSFYEFTELLDKELEREQEIRKEFLEREKDPDQDDLRSNYHKKLNELIDEQNTITDSMNIYISAVHSILEHIVHTDQTFLMVPGLSGTSYSIPIKLTLMYQWAINVLFEILNDGKHKYSCILYPDMGASPETRIIPFNSPNMDRLICVRVSQRTIYLPNYLLMIITHEIGHYVGDQCRLRKERFEYVMKSAASYLVMQIWPEEYTLPDVLTLKNRNSSEELATIRSELFDYLCETVIRKVESQFKEGSELYMDEVQKLSIQSMKRVLSKECFDEINELFAGIYNEIWQSNEAREKCIQSIGEIHEFQRNIESNLRDLMDLPTVKTIIEDIFKLYKEVYADTVSRVVLKYSIEDFQDCLTASVGSSLRKNNKTLLDIIRVAIMAVTFHDEDKIKIKKYEDAINVYYGSTDVSEYLEAYAEHCKEQLEAQITSNEKLMNLRKVFQAFSSSETEASEIYDEIIASNKSYTDEIQNKLAEKID